MDSSRHRSCCAARLGRGQPQKILEQLDPSFRQKTFRMKLHTVDREPPMAQSHNFTRRTGIFRPGANFEIIVDCVGADDQAVVACGDKRIFQPGKHAV